MLRARMSAQCDRLDRKRTWTLTSAVGSGRTRAATGEGGGRRHLLGSRYREGDVQLVLPARTAGAAELPDRRGGGQLVVGAGPGRSCAGGDRGLRRAQIVDDMFDRIAARMSYVSGDFGGAATCVRVKSAIWETQWQSSRDAAIVAAELTSDGRCSRLLSRRSRAGTDAAVHRRCTRGPPPSQMVVKLDPSTGIRMLVEAHVRKHASRSR